MKLDHPDAPAVAPAEIVPLEVLERRAILHALAALDGNMSLAAKRLGLGRATLYRKLSQYGIAGGHDPA
jgi:transcriptional regulator of acetoin/glycerol metabolism